MEHVLIHEVILLIDEGKVSKEIQNSIILDLNHQTKRKIAAKVSPKFSKH